MDLQTIGLLDQAICQVMRHLEGFVFREAVFGDQPRQEGAVNAPSHIMPRGNGEERARVVIEAHGVVEARRLRGLLAETHHALGTVKEPPGRPQAQAGIVAGERRQLAAEGRLIQREQNDGEVALVAKAVEQRAQRVDIIGRPREYRRPCRGRSARRSGGCGCARCRDESA